MSLQQPKFRRLFSKTMYKNLHLPLWELTFTKDFVDGAHGDMYPVVAKTTDCAEMVANNRYILETGSVSRMAGAFFPYATYEMTFRGTCGFSFRLSKGTAAIVCRQDSVEFTCEKDKQIVPCSVSKDDRTMLVTCRPGAFDVYFAENGKPVLLQTFTAETFADSNLQAVFQTAFVCVSAEGSAEILSARSYMDCGISQADMRPIRYENGDVMVENGKVYLSATVRMEAGSYQGIFSWVPGTSQFELIGALFYDCGDGKWCGDVAASILHNKETGRWKLWVCAFSHGHILGHAEFGGDPRLGVNVIDITLMEKAEEGTPASAFAAFPSDEDPDFYYNEAEQKWYMAICRIDPAKGNYCYHFFRSDSPFDGYEYLGCGLEGAETGGSFVNFRGERVFACGNSMVKRADYRIYTKDGMIQPKFDFDDGGFRGWGTIIPVELGSRTRYFWLTFDRHKGSAFPWSYGNWYGFEDI